VAACVHDEQVWTLDATSSCAWELPGITKGAPPAGSRRPRGTIGSSLASSSSSASSTSSHRLILAEEMGDENVPVSTPR